MQLKHNIWRKILKAGLVFTTQILIPSTAIFAQSCAREEEIVAEVKKLQVEKKTIEKKCNDEKKMKKSEYQEKKDKMGKRHKKEEEDLKTVYKLWI